MRLINLFTIGLITSSSLFASTTMCFKENHTSITTIESTPLDGGLCSSSKSINDMKKEGWSVEDIKIEDTKNGKNYIYILKKEDKTPSTTLDEKALEQRIMQRLEDRKVQEVEAKKLEIKQTMSKNGKQMYVDKCQVCHGEKAEKKAYATSRPLIELDYDDMRQSIKDYMYDNYDRGNAHVMKPYLSFITESRLKDIYSYIQSLKPEEKKEEESK